MTRLAFTKGHGTGNDFVIIADPEGQQHFTREQTAALCDRHFGIGADGFLRVVRSAYFPEEAAAADSGAEWFMDYRNADGSVAEMCGNGVRVYVRYLLESGLAKLDADNTIQIGTRNGVVAVQSSADGFEVNLGSYRIEENAPRVKVRGLEVARPGLSVNLGNPHVVVVLSQLRELGQLDLSERPVLDPDLPDGANVEFVVPRDPLVHQGVGGIRMRVYERGVGETLSCGTGVAAAALAVAHWADAVSPESWQVEVPGGVLGVRIEDSAVFLSGPAALVYTGEIALV